MSTRLTILTLSLCLLSCKDETTTGLPSDPLARWESFNLHNYTIDQTASCFCPTGGSKMLVTVRSDTVFSVLRLSDNTTLTFAEAQLYHSIDELFETIQTISDSIVVRYNDAYGYPEYLDIDPAGHPVDAGVLYETTNLQIQ